MSAPISCETCLVRQYAVYGGLHHLSLAEITALRRSQRTLKDGRLIFREGELAQTVYTLYDGWAFKYKTLFEGHRQILGFYMPGDLLVAQAISGAALPFSVRAVTPVTLCAFETNAYFNFMMTAPEARRGLRDYMFARHNETDDLVTALGRRSAMSRVAYFLESLVRRMDERGLAVGGSFRIPVSQGLLADALGLTQVYVNRVAAQLKSKGIVETNRNEIHILDVDALRACASGAK